MQAPIQPAQLELYLGAYRLSRLLHAATGLGLVAAMAEGPRDLDGLASRTRTHPGTLRAVLDALSAWGVFAREAEDRYALTPVSRRLLPGEPGGIDPLLVTGWVGHPAVAEAFVDLEHTIATGECGLARRHGTSFHGLLSRQPALADRYNDAMVSTVTSFEAAAQAVNFSESSHIVDIGGGQGGLLEAILARNPNARGVSFDLEHAFERHARPRCGGRLTFESGDAFAAVPAGADTYLTSTVLRCFDDEACIALLGNVRRAMLPHSRLFCFEMMIPPGRDHPMMALADITARVVYGGKDRTEDEFRALVLQAGLRWQGATPVEGATFAMAGTC